MTAKTEPRTQMGRSFLGGVKEGDAPADYIDGIRDIILRIETEAVASVPELNPEQVSRLMEAVDKIDRLNELVNPPPRPPRTRTVTRYIDRPTPEVDLAAVAKSIESRLVLLDAITVEAMTDAMLASYNGVSGNFDSKEQRRRTRLQAEWLIEELQKRLMPDPSILEESDLA